MQVKGSVVKSIDNFIAEKYPAKFEAWKNALSSDAQKIYSNSIFATEWYPIKESIIEPTEHMSAMFYDSSVNKAAWESGRYSAEVALQGIYKVFILISTPSYIMKRASKIMASFYQPTQLEVVDSTNKSILVHILELPINSEIIESRIGGWMERALEICGCNGLTIDKTKSLAKGDQLTAYEIRWQ